jgi:TPR repeat protein
MRPFATWTVLALTLGISPVIGDDADLPALQAAAAKGDPVAEQELGRAYQLGQGVPVDFTKALELYRKSAAQGNAKAMNNLGILYHYGKGVPADDKEADRWLLQAAAKDLPAAELAVGLGYRSGDLGFARDPKSAEKWLIKATAHPEEPRVFAPAANALGALYEAGLKAGQPDFAKAIAWYLKAADLNDPRAEANLGMLYHSDLAGKKDLVTAYMWFRLAAAQDEPRAVHSVSDMLDEHELTDAQVAEGDRRATAFRAAHKVNKPLPAPKHVMTPDSLLLKAALHQQALQNSAGTNAAPTASTGTK